MVMSMVGYLALSAVLLAASPGATGDTGLEPRTNIQALSSAAGILGAAIRCDRIPHARISAAAGEIGALATANVISLEQVAAIHRVLMASAVAGWQAQKDGKIDCKSVEASFNEIEEVIVQTPVALRRN